MRTLVRRRASADPTKEIPRMSKRLATLAALLGAATMLLSVLPLASASASSPWWQVLTGSRPTNLWEPVDKTEVQKLNTQALNFLGASSFAAKVEVGGQVVGCLGSGEIPGLVDSNLRCEEETGHSADETAAELEETLEGPYGAGNVEVSGGPAGAGSFEVKTAWAPPISLSVIAFEFSGQPFQMGTASSEVLTEGSGRLVLTLTNLGDAPVDGSTTPVTIVDKLPVGVTAYGTEAFAGFRNLDGPVNCTLLSAGKEVSCSFTGQLPAYEAIEIEVLASLDGSPPLAAAPGAAPGEVTVTGGGATASGASQAIEVSAQKTPFGVEYFSAQSEEEGGAVSTQAGGHPFQFTTTLQLNSGAVTPAPTRRESIVEQPAVPRNVHNPLALGLVGNPTAVPQCSAVDFFSNEPKGFNSCAPETAVGVASVTIVEPLLFGPVRVAAPVFNLQPTEGEPARFGFLPVGVPVTIDTAVDPDDGYRITASVSNATQAAALLSTTITLWGNPGDPRHDAARGWNCASPLPFGPCTRPESLGETAFLRQPVSCSSPLSFGFELEPWNVPLGSVKSTKSSSSPALLGCNKVPFDPSIAAAPTSKLATNPSGLDFALNLPNSGLDNSAAIAETEPKKVEVDLPEGMTANPSQAEGLAVCTPDDFKRETLSSRPGEGCPEASKIGSVEATTPLLAEKAEGSLYIAAPHDNPFNSLLALYLVAKVPERGVIVKQAGEVKPDPRTGQLRTVFDGLPQLPYSTFKLHFREGGRAPLVTPPACGSYDTLAKFTPYSAVNPDNPDLSEIFERNSPSKIERGVDGGACPAGGTPPFHPGLVAGSTNNAAGRYSPFNIRIFRDDSEQEITHFSIKLPPGITGKLAGIPFCSDAQVAAAEGREHDGGGGEEQRNPSCPGASQIGRTLVGAGVGSILTYVPGKLYLAGPYHGSQLSIVSVTSAVVGPFDVGTVVVREALKINPETAEVFIDATGSDPIPHIIDGIRVHLRDIRAYTDRPQFTLNPTSCEPTSTASTVLGSGTDFASEADDQPVTVTSRYQAADCANLGFKPNLKLNLKGGTRRGKNPALRATLLPRAGDANSARVSVQLPHSEFLDQSHIRTVCTRVQFNAGAGNGANCPRGAIYGHARAFSPLLAEPLEGPVFLRSSSHPLPDLVLAMHGLFDFDAVGRIDSVKGGIRNTFDFVPDAPITKVVLNMQGGKKGLLVNSTNICKGKHKAIAKFTGHNGKLHNFNPRLQAKCGKKARKHKGHKKHSRRR